MSNLKARGIILKKTKYSEADLILQLILSKGEKISLLARGALKSKKRFSGGVLEPTHFVEVQYKSAKEGQLGTLQEAHIIEDFAKIRTDYDRLEKALFCISAITKISQEGDVHSEGLFNLLGNSLRVLQEVKNLEIFKATFCLKLLYQQGVLEKESWMSLFLQIPISELVLQEEKFALSQAQVVWCHTQLEYYLKMAGVH